MLRALLDPAVSDLTENSLAGCDFTLLDGADPQSTALGVTAIGELTLVVTDTTRPLGAVRVQCSGQHTVLFVDNRTWGGNLQASIRTLGTGSLVFFNDIGDRFVRLYDVSLRSHGQVLFWGRGASAVGCSMEIDGTNAIVAVGDDALISDDVWFRNHDMHAIHDLASGAAIGRPAVNTILERHVWLGHGAMLLQAERIGMGAIVGARALVKGGVPAKAVVAGTPARVIRDNVSWGRLQAGMTAAERLSIGLDPL